jgi:hypothetical protein
MMVVAFSMTMAVAFLIGMEKRSAGVKLMLLLVMVTMMALCLPHSVTLRAMMLVLMVTAISILKE